MLILDEFIRNKFLEDISSLLIKFGIEEEPLTPGIFILKFLVLSEHFSKEIFDIYTEHYKRIFTTLEILASKQGLDNHRQVFSIIRDYINRNNIELTLSDLVGIYLSHNRANLVVPLEGFRGLRIVNPK